MTALDDSYQPDQAALSLNGDNAKLEPHINQIRDLPAFTTKTCQQHVGSTASPNKPSNKGPEIAMPSATLIPKHLWEQLSPSGRIAATAATDAGGKVIRVENGRPVVIGIPGLLDLSRNTVN
ncbi:MAG: hypothetical protein Q9227_009540 [Pyrenula ochraceoflavens]